MGSGGGNSGQIGFPLYMETIHSDWLDGTGVDTMGSSITDIMNTAQGASPWVGVTAYDPDADITAFEAAVAGFDTILAGINEDTEWAALFTQAETSIVIVDKTIADIAVADKAVAGITNAVIVADEVAFAATLDDQILNTVLPRFQGGMRDINAVVSSSFVIGEAVIEGFRDRDVSKHSSGLRLSAASKNAEVDIAEAQMNISKDVEVSKGNISKDISVAQMNIGKDIAVEQIRNAATDRMSIFLMQKYAWERDYMNTVIESRRIKIVAKKEELEEQSKFDEEDALWDMEVFQYGANILGSIGSGVVKPSKPSKARSALGGAMSGAAAGAYVGSVVPGIGTAIGAIVGGIVGAASGLL